MTLRWLDAHLDLAYLAETGRNMSLAAEACGAVEGRGAGAAVTLPALREGGVGQVLGTIFTQERVSGRGPEHDVDGPWCYSSEEEAHVAALRQVSIYLEWQKRGWVRLAGVSDGPATAGAIEVLLLMEGAAGVRTLHDLQTFHCSGVRVLGLTWASGSKYAGGNSSEGGLTAAGRELVGLMDQLGMVHDVSHLSERAFWELMEAARGPRVATHSNCRALLPGKEANERHLTDEQIRAIGGTGGMIGVNLFTKFLRADGRATVEDVVRHVIHIAEVMGRRNGVGLGSDMDGGFAADMLPTGVEHPRALGAIAAALRAAGWSETEVAGFAGDNWRRFLNYWLKLGW